MLIVRDTSTRSLGSQLSAPVAASNGLTETPLLSNSPADRGFSSLNISRLRFEVTL
jgi:hypothetical protein